jgi:hypothetical protein
MPVACYRTKKTPVLHITGTKVAALLPEAVNKIQPSTPDDDLKKYSALSLCVWACLLLDKAGKSPAFIQKWLRCLGNSFKMYLCDMKAIQDKHLSACHLASAGIMTLINTPPETFAQLTAMMCDLDVTNNGTTVDQMGDYINEMD